MINQELDPSVEVVHLRRLLDTQPSCLMRLGDDGSVLAANDAALRLLDVPSHAQVLTKDFAAWIAPEHRDRWQEFSFQVVEGSPASVECDVVGPSGDRHATLFHGVPLAGHPDGLASMAVVARAVSAQRQLEASVLEHEGLLEEFEAERLQARERLAEADACRQMLEEKVRALEALQDRAGSGSEEELLRQLRADLEARDAALATESAARRAAERKCDQALADCRQLETALEGFAARYEQVTAERAVERQRVLQMVESIGEKHRQELAAALSAREATRQELIAELSAATAERAAAMAERDRLVTALRKHAALLTALADESSPNSRGQCAEGAADAAFVGSEERRA